MAVTFDRMAKKKSSPGSGDGPTDVVRLDKELVRRIGIICQARNIKANQLIAPFLRPFIDREFEKTVKRLGEEVTPPGD